LAHLPSLLIEQAEQIEKATHEGLTHL